MADAKARGTKGVWRPGLPDKTRVELKSATRDFYAAGIGGRHPVLASHWPAPSQSQIPLV